MLVLVLVLRSDAFDDAELQMTPRTLPIAMPMPIMMTLLLRLMIMVMTMI